MRQLTLVSIGALALTIGSGLCATERGRESVAVTDPPGQAAPSDTVDGPLAAGQIVAVDREGGHVTVAHRGIARFYLEPSTRVFRVEAPILLTGLTPGDKIRFDVERDGRSFVITRLENSN